MPQQFTPVTHIKDLPPGSCQSFEIQDYGIALFNLEGEIHALDNTCPHAGGPLGEGTIEGDLVACPWHDWKFNIRTGICQKNPSPSWTVSRYEVRVEHDIIQIALPQSPAET